MGQAGHLHHPVGPGAGRKGVEQHPGLGAQTLFLGQDIHRKAETDKEVKHAAHHVAGGIDGTAQNGHASGGNPFGGFLHRVLPVDGGHIPYRFIQRGGQIRIGIHQVGDPLLRRSPEQGQLIADLGHGGAQLRDHQPQHQRHHRHYRHQHQQHGQRPAAAGLHLGGQQFFKGPHGYIQDKGDGTADQKRPQQPGDPVDQVHQGFVVLQRPVQQDAARRQQRDGTHRAFIQFHWTILPAGRTGRVL